MVKIRFRRTTMRLLGIGLTILVIVLLANCSVYRSLSEVSHEADRLVDQKLVRSTITESQNLPIYTVTRNSPTPLADIAPRLVFVHGTPGDWTIFAKQLADDKVAAQAELVAIDRPGWSNSAIGDYQFLTFEQQAQYLEPLLERWSADRPLILVGHSYGASLVVGLTMRYSKWVDGVVAIAGDLTPEYRKPRWYNHLGASTLIYQLLPRAWKGANDEVMALREEMAALQNNWSDLAVPVWVIQGGKDSLVDKRNADFAKQLTTASTIEVLYGEKFGHLVHVTHPKLVNSLLLDAIKTVSGNKP